MSGNHRIKTHNYDKGNAFDVGEIEHSLKRKPPLIADKALPVELSAGLLFLHRYKKIGGDNRE